MSKEYKYGRRKELQIGEFLERRGHKWWRSPGSKGPIDIFVVKTSRKWAIQVKSTRKDLLSSKDCFPDNEWGKLIRAARQFMGKPILALVSRNYVVFYSIPDGKLILHGNLKPLKRKYRNER